MSEGWFGKFNFLFASLESKNRPVGSSVVTVAQDRLSRSVFNTRRYLLYQEFPC
jgi:hypothetical protein